MSNFYNNLYRNLSQKDKQQFENSTKHILYNQRHINRMRKSGHDAQMDAFAAIPDILLFLFLMGIGLFNAQKVLEGDGNNIVKLLYIAVFGVYMICAFIIILLDLDTTECYFLNYKKSSYYLSTGVRHKMLKKNKGLVGEFKAYVLSRTLKVPHKILYNVCVPMQNGSFQEIDALIITRKMLYVLECKNIDGKFIGEYTDKDWKQILGSQQHDKENIYIQNQGHTMALDYFLLTKGIIQNGQNVCINMALSSGSAEVPSKNIPMDFRFGNVKILSNFINSYDEKYCSGVSGNGFMDTVYEELLPYSLYTDIERSNMVQERKI